MDIGGRKIARCEQDCNTFSLRDEPSSVLHLPEFQIAALLQRLAENCWPTGMNVFEYAKKNRCLLLLYGLHYCRKFATRVL